MNPENQPKVEPEEVESDKSEAKKKTEEGTEDDPPPLTPNTKSEENEDVKMETEEKTEEPKKNTAPEDDEDEIPKKVF